MSGTLGANDKLYETLQDLSPVRQIRWVCHNWPWEKDDHMTTISFWIFAILVGLKSSLK